jgi:hypothetical protein
MVSLDEHHCCHQAESGFMTTYLSSKIVADNLFVSTNLSILAHFASIFTPLKSFFSGRRPGLG